VIAQVQPTSLFGSLKSLGYRLWDEQSRKLIGFAHLERLRMQTKEAGDRRTDVGRDDLQESDRQSGTHWQRARLQHPMGLCRTAVRGG
jgi:hypothetical protein